MHLEYFSYTPINTPYNLNSYCAWKLHDDFSNIFGRFWGEAPFTPLLVPITEIIGTPQPHMYLERFLKRRKAPLNRGFSGGSKSHEKSKYIWVFAGLQNDIVDLQKRNICFANNFSSGKEAWFCFLSTWLRHAWERHRSLSVGLARIEAIASRNHGDNPFRAR